MFNRISEVQVIGAPRDAVPQLAVLEGTVDDPDRTERVAQLALRDLRSRGYAAATLAVSRRTRCGIGLDVHVTLGPRYRIASITFDTGASNTGASDTGPSNTGASNTGASNTGPSNTGTSGTGTSLPGREAGTGAPIDPLAALEDSLGTVNTVGGVYIEYRMKRALTELERRYRDAGWLEATLGAPRTRYFADGTIAIAIPATAGRRFRIGSITAVGASPTARAAVLQTLGLHAGDYYDGPSVRTAIERARKKLDRWVELRTAIAGDRPRVDVEAIMDTGNTGDARDTRDTRDTRATRDTPAPREPRP
jgi:outer membrane protein assembly factor BamA